MATAIELTEEMISELVSLYGVKGEKELARHFKVSRSTIRRWHVRADVSNRLPPNCGLIFSPPPPYELNGLQVGASAFCTRFVESGDFRLRKGEEVEIQCFWPKTKTTWVKSPRFDPWASIEIPINALRHGENPSMLFPCKQRQKLNAVINFRLDKISKSC